VDRLAIEIDAGQDAEAAELVGLALQLRQRLLELDVEAVESPATSAPLGTKAVDGTIVGVLLVTVTPALVRATVEVICAWLAKAQARTVRIELGDDVLELTGAATKDQPLIARFLDRHADGS
jgi:hypothetical protein